MLLRLLLLLRVHLVVVGGLCSSNTEGRTQLLAQRRELGAQRERLCSQRCLGPL